MFVDLDARAGFQFVDVAIAELAVVAETTLTR